MVAVAVNLFSSVDIKSKVAEYENECMALQYYDYMLLIKIKIS